MAARTKKSRSDVRPSGDKLPEETTLPEVSPDEAADLYPGEWIVMKVLEVDEHDWPVRGQVLVHSPSRRGISKVETQVLSLEERPEHPYWITQAVHYIRTGEGLRQTLEKMAREGDTGGWRRW